MQAFPTTGMDGARTDRATWQVDLFLAIFGAVASLLLSLATGVNKLGNSGGDNDSLMRLVEVRDLIAGQSWFDLTQYRMGPAGGFEMHWSRLVDAPIAALIWLAGLFTGDSARAEMSVAWLWPGLLLVACLFLLVRIARGFAGSEAVFPAAVLGLAALHFMGIFAPGSFDHHNVQLALILGAVTALVASSTWRAGLVAGVAAAVSLAVGMETAPLVAALGAAVALAFLIRGDAERPLALGYGIGFAAGAVLASVSTLQPLRWLSVTCDAWSGAQAGTAIIAGAGLIVIAATPPLAATARRRFLSLAGLGAVVAVFAVTAFPACLADPYAGLDPLLRDYWLDWVTEAQNALSLIANNPGEAAGLFMTPLIAMAFLGMLALDRSGGRKVLIVGFLLAAAFAVSLWQVRGAVFSVPLAIIPLAALIARARGASATRAGLWPTLAVAAAWLVSFNIAWHMGVARLVNLSAAEEGAVAEVLPSRPCYATGDYAGLASMSPETVLAVSNLGASILYATDHRALSGPYHRNADGNLAALVALTGDTAAAHTIIEEAGVGLVAHCPGNNETKVLAAKFPHSLVADLQRDQLPVWLDRLDTPGPLQLFRVRH